MSCAHPCRHKMENSGGRAKQAGEAAGAVRTGFLASPRRRSSATTTICLRSETLGAALKRQPAKDTDDLGVSLRRASRQAFITRAPARAPRPRSWGSTTRCRSRSSGVQPRAPRPSTCSPTPGLSFVLDLQPGAHFASDSIPAAPPQASELQPYAPLLVGVTQGSEFDVSGQGTSLDLTIHCAITRSVAVPELPLAIFLAAGLGAVLRCRAFRSC